MTDRKIIELRPLQVTIGEAARILRYSKRTVYRMIRAGELPARGRGRLLRIAVADLEAHVEASRQEGIHAA